MYKKYTKAIKINLEYVKAVWKQNKVYVIITAFVNLINSIFPLVNIIIPKLVIDAVIAGVNIQSVLAYITLLAVVNISSGAVNTFLTNNYLSVQGSICSMQFLVNISSKAAKLDMNQIEKQENIVKMNLAKNVIYRGIHQDLIAGLFSFIGSVVMLFTTAGILLRANPFFVPIIIIVLIVNMYLGYKVEIDNVDFQAENQKSMTKMNYFTDILEGKGFIKEIRLYGLSDWIKYKCSNTMREINQAFIKINTKWYPVRLLQTFINNLLNYGLYLWLAVMAFAKRISVGDFTMFFAATSSFSSNFNNCISFLSKISVNAEYLASYNDFMSMRSIIDNPNTKYKGAASLDTGNFILKLNNVSFRYNEAQELVLKNVNFEFHKGNVYAIVGRNGAGKTTLINLLCRFYDVGNGSITLNGTDIREIPVIKYRENFSAIFQNFGNLSFSIRENVVLDKKSDDEKLANLFGQLEMLDMVEKYPYGFDTVLNKVFDDNGIILSGGQNQRIAIARALYREAPVLILDEPTSALDPISEDNLIRLIHQHTQDKVVIYVSHRLSSTALADCVIFIDDNTIADYGRHSDLYRRNLKYKEFYDAQAKYYQ